MAWRHDRAAEDGIWNEPTKKTGATVVVVVYDDDVAVVRCWTDNHAGQTDCRFGRDDRSK